MSVVVYTGRDLSLQSSLVTCEITTIVPHLVGTLARKGLYIMAGHFLQLSICGQAA